MFTKVFWEATGLAVLAGGLTGYLGATAGKEVTDITWAGVGFAVGGGIAGAVLTVVTTFQTLGRAAIETAQRSRAAKKR